MTEITQADRDMAAHVWRALDADQLDTASLQIFFARHRMEERAAIVAWLRKDDEAGITSVLADAIEYGDHLK